MRFTYTLLLYLILPFALLRLLWRSLSAPGYAQRWGERLGRVPRVPAPGGIWIHAVSVGEVQAALPLICQLLKKYPDLPLTVTTTTPTGSDRVRELLHEQVTHQYLPFDLPLVQERFLAALRPRLVLMMETEIWPNMLWVCQQRGIPAILANARLSERSARGYARLGDFARETFGRISLIAAQSPADARRFEQLGVAPSRIQVTGSIKFDVELSASLREQSLAMRRMWGENRPVWVAASTHEGEEEQILAAHRLIRERVPQALLALVPRHPERFERVADLVKKQGLSLLRRTEHTACDQEIDVFLGNTMGELPAFLAAADVAFIGGSLVAIGGHNILEAAATGVPVVFGPHMFNFAQIAALLLEAGAARRIHGPAELADVIGRWLLDASERARVGEQGMRVLERNRGAVQRLLGLIEPWLRQVPTER